MRPAYEKELFVNKFICLSVITIILKCDETMINKLRLSEEYEQIMYEPGGSYDTAEEIEY